MSFHFLFCLKKINKTGKTTEQISKRYDHNNEAESQKPRNICIISNNINTLLKYIHRYTCISINSVSRNYLKRIKRF